MTCLLFLFLSPAFAAQPLQLETALTLEAVPDDAEELISMPMDVAVAENGRIFLLDAGAIRVFVWDADGSYIGQYGKKGQGPGEFQFSGGMGGPEGYISVENDRVFVYDGANKLISIFDEDFEFIENHAFSLPAGRVEQVRLVAPERLFVFYSSWFSDNPYRKVGLFAIDGEQVQTVTEIEDKTWKYGSESGQRRVVLIPYAPTLVTAWNAAADQFVVADSATPSFEVYDRSGKLARTVQFDLPRRDMTKEDIEEWNEMNWFKNQNFLQVEFPDKKAYFNTILPLPDGRFLVGLQSVNYRNFEGYLIESSGAVSGRVTYQCGSQGGLFSSREKLIAVKTDEFGDFTIELLEPTS